MSESNKRVRVAVIGASGYIGAELVRLLASHPAADIVALTADRNAGHSLATLFPHLATMELPRLIKVDDIVWRDVDFVFCCLPHGASQELVLGFPDHVRIVDLSADFRLSVELYEAWYKLSHLAPDLQKEAVYGLTEIARDNIRSPRLVANPGCYPTSILLPLIPLVENHLIEETGIIIDSKSGVSGAGRSLRESSLHGEVSEGAHAYGISDHFHTAEIEQSLSVAAGHSVQVSFTPHLLPMNRGILSTIYVQAKGGTTIDELMSALKDRYVDEHFVRIVDTDVVPHTRHVRGSNYCLIGLYADRITGRAIICSVEDNLVKGGSGQAIQNMNVMMGLEETWGLDQKPIFP